MSASAPNQSRITTIIYHHGYWPIRTGEDLLALMRQSEFSTDVPSYIAFAAERRAHVALGALPETLPHHVATLDSGEPMAITPENLNLATATVWLDAYRQRLPKDVERTGNDVLACPYSRYTRPSEPVSQRLEFDFSKES